TDRPKTPKRTAIFRLQTIATLRFEWLSKAARLIRPRGASVLRLADNVPTSRIYHRIHRALAA
ncbi:MAG TPA: hypothetical protein VHC69_05945, partial [Polyangiaceae bacterium]|nr:hypothetical protein [Polyangiaceae bacterium]